MDEDAVRPMPREHSAICYEPEERLDAKRRLHVEGVVSRCKNGIGVPLRSPGSSSTAVGPTN
eukprot:525934-Amphidinium_carterae.1